MDAQIKKNAAYYDSSLLSAVGFAERYDLHKDCVYVAYNHKNKHIIKIGNSLYVNETALIKRREFYNRVWNKAHENYYLITEYITDAQLYQFLGRALVDCGTAASWMQFIKYDLFSIAFKDKSLLSYKIKEKVWIFFRATTFIIRRLTRYEKLVEFGKMRRIKSGGLKR